MPAVDPPYAFLAELTHRCPLACPYCSNPLDLARASAELGTADWGRIMREAAELGAISGGRQTRWTILAKLGLLLGADRGLPDIRQAFATSWAGEPL